MKIYRKSLLCLLAHAGLVFAATGGTTQVICQEIQSPVLAKATVTLSPGRRVPANFFGFSHEWGVAQQILGSDERGVNFAYRQLLRNLMLSPGQTLIVRVGGSSTDKTGNVGEDTTRSFVELFASLGVHFVLGANLGANNIQLTLSQVRAFVNFMPTGSLDAIELGNEPENYPGDGFQTTPYSLTSYMSNFNRFRTALAPLLPPRIGLMAPAWGRAWQLKDLGSFEDAEGPLLKIVTVHNYPGSHCGGKVNPPDFLLMPASSSAEAHAVAPYVEYAHRTGHLFRIGEMNSVECAGEDGVSNTFASALWAADSMFEFLNSGVDGVNWHTGIGSNPYDAFTFRVTIKGGKTFYTLSAVAPEYFGFLVFQDATSDFASLLPVNLVTSANLKVWATMAGSGTIRVLILNKDKQRSGVVSVVIPGRAVAQVVYLAAPSYDAKSHVSLGGQTFDGSSDGNPIGAKQSDHITGMGGSTLR